MDLVESVPLIESKNSEIGVGCTDLKRVHEFVE